MKTRCFVSLFAAAMMAAAPAAHAADPLTVAVFDFESKEEALRDLGPRAATLLNAFLSADPRLITVERAELDKALGEQELALSGTVAPETAAQIGHLTGAKVLITGRMFTSGRDLLVVTKIIGAETGRVYGEVGTGEMGGVLKDLMANVAQQVAKTVEARADTLVAKVETPEDRLTRLRKAMEGQTMPVVALAIRETHVGSPAIDPAAETEIGRLLKQLGCTVVDKNDAAGKARAEVEITGEAFSEFGMRKGNLISCRGRVELKAVERATGTVLFVDRQTSVAVDVAEQVAGKAALQQAAAQVAERLAPALGRKKE